MRDRADAGFLELVSAWLDGQLDPAETEKLESLLRENKQARLAAEEVELTRLLLRSAKLKPVPHHFILTREMAAMAKPRPAWLFSTWLARFSGALAAVLLVAAGYLTVLQGSAPAAVTLALEPEPPMAMEISSAEAPQVQLEADTNGDVTSQLDEMELEWFRPPSSENTEASAGKAAVTSDQPSGIVSYGAGPAFDSAGGVGGSGDGGYSSPFTIPANAIPDEAMPRELMAQSQPSEEAAQVVDNGPILGVALPVEQAAAAEIYAEGEQGEQMDSESAAALQQPVQQIQPLVAVGMAGLGLLFAALTLFLVLRRP